MSDVDGSCSLNLTVIAKEVRPIMKRQLGVRPSKHAIAIIYNAVSIKTAFVGSRIMANLMGCNLAGARIDVSCIHLLNVLVVHRTWTA